MATVPVIIRQEVPAHLTADTPLPVWTGATNADLVDYVLSLRQALGSCNAAKAAIRGGPSGVRAILRASKSSRQGTRSV